MAESTPKEQEVLDQIVQEEIGVKKLYLISYDIKAEDAEVYDRVHDKIQKKLDEINAKKVLKSQRAVQSTTLGAKLCDEIINAVPPRDRRSVALLVTPFCVGDAAYHGVDLDASLRHL